jgi:hypothetical protein
LKLKMHFKGGNPRFKASHIRNFWNAKVPDHHAFTEKAPSSLLVALTIKGSPSKINEIAFASSNGYKLLVGFDIYPEVNWISSECPSIARLFTSWVDLQEIVQEISPGALRPGLIGITRWLGLTGMGMNRKKQYRAANDCQNASSYFLSFIYLWLHFYYFCKATKTTGPYTPTEANLKVSLFCSSLCCGQRKTSSYLSKCRLNSTPFCTIQSHCSGLNSHGFKKSGGVKVWWLAFPTLEAMEAFAAENEGSVIEDKTLVLTTLCVHYGTPHLQAVI